LSGRASSCASTYRLRNDLDIAATVVGHCWHVGYDPYIWQSRATEEQTTAGWEMVVRIEKIVAVLQHDGYNQQQAAERSVQTALRR